MARSVTSIANFRIIKLNSDDTFALCGASDEPWGFLTGWEADPPEIPVEQKMIYPYSHWQAKPIILEADAGATFTRGQPCFQAASGKVSHTGSRQVGVMDSVAPSVGSLTLWKIW
jgi:hypothetical protein